MAAGADPDSECGGLSCAGWYWGWDGGTCHARADAADEAVGCDGNRGCQTAAEICPQQGKGDAATVCDATCQQPDANTCTSTTAGTCRNLDAGAGTQSCGVGECERTVARCADGRPQACVEGDPVDEVCDGRDNDCDGDTDEAYACCEPGPVNPGADPEERWVQVCPGTFAMGSPDGDVPEEYRGDEVQHEVTLTRPFLVKATELTQAEWVALMGSNPSYFRAGGGGGCAGDPCDSRPALLLLRHAREPDLLQRLLLWTELFREVACSSSWHELTMILEYILEVAESLQPRDLQDFFRDHVQFEASEEIMTLAEKLREEGRREGLEKGRHEGLEEGRQEGLEKGLEKGRCKGQQELLLRQMRLRFRQLPGEVVARIEAASSAELERWAERVLTAATPEEVVAG